MAGAGGRKKGGGSRKKGAGRRGGGDRSAAGRGKAAERSRAGAKRVARARSKRVATLRKRRRRSRRAAWGGRVLRLVGGVLLFGGFVGGIAVAGWVIALDRIVVDRFEGRTFAVPSKVLSAPTILYPGLDWKQIGLRSTLLRLGYREQRLQPGMSGLDSARFAWRRDRIRLHLRAFEHPSRPEPDREVELRLDDDIISGIYELPAGREVGAVLLEPELVGAYYGSTREQRDLVRLQEVPRYLPQAIFAVEDQRFETHHGVDLRRIAGAFIANIRAGGITQGGSTLTQQLVKNFFLTPERTVKRKLQEALMSILVEARYDKEEILESYLNEIYLGQRGATAIHGVGEAAGFFFGKSATDLSLAESAQIAAVIQSPTRLSPHRNPERAVDRRNLVLALMHKQGRITEAEYEAAHREPLHVSNITPERAETRYFLDFLRRQLPEVYDKDVLQATGLRIYSTLDPRFQAAAVSALTRGLEQIETRHPDLVSDVPASRLQGCVVAMRPRTGEILALAGGRDYGESQFDRCTQARRQVGSVFKTFVFAAALEPDDGVPAITLATPLVDEPLELETRTGVWAPENYDHEFRGRVSVRESLARSLNVPTARLALDVGIDRVSYMASRLGVTSRLPRVPSLALGTAELSPLEVARAYATLASGGFRSTPHTFEDVTAPEVTLDRRELEAEQVLDSGTAYLVTSLLEGVIDEGTGVRARWMGLTGPVAGKTGTTDREFDLWFVGYTPDLVAVVWIGFDEPRSIDGVSSTEGPLPIWVNFVKGAVGSAVPGRFLRPPSIRELDIDPETGARALFRCPRRESELFLAGTEPEETCPTRAAGGREGDPRDGSGAGFFDWLRGRF